MFETLDMIMLIPVLFLIPVLPYVNNLFKGVDVEKFAYAASTSGILLTFYGIWMGLLGFDTTNIEGSIPTLLDGLKVAFGSSILGLGVSMIISLFFVKSKDPVEEQLEDVVSSLEELGTTLDNFAKNSTEMHTQTLISGMKRLVEELELGINSETQDVMAKFRSSVEFMQEWQKRHVDEIKSVADVLGKNAEVTKNTSEQLDKTNKTLDKLGPTTDRVANAIDWIQTALPSTRPRVRTEKKEDE